MNVILVGCGGHAKVIADIVEKQGDLQIVGVLDRSTPRGTRWRGYEVLGHEDDLPTIVANHLIQGAIVAIGDNNLRAKISQAIKQLAPILRFPNAVHPSAQIASGARLGEGNVVMAGAAVNSDTTVGDFCILNTLSSVDHDGLLGNYVSFAPHACAGGNVTVGDYSAISLGASIIHRIRIGQRTVVGAGSTVVRDLPDDVVAYGTPARVVRSRQPGEKYL